MLGRHRLLAAVVGLTAFTACDREDRLTAGMYSLDVVGRGDLGASDDVIASFTMEPDGAFTGMWSQPSASCLGRLAEEDLNVLTEHLNRDDALARDMESAGCIDTPIYEFDVVVVAGDEAGRSNTFEANLCDEESPGLLESITLI